MLDKNSLHKNDQTTCLHGKYGQIIAPSAITKLLYCVYIYINKNAQPMA